jgi:hypothetical protein
MLTPFFGLVQSPKRAKCWQSSQIFMACLLTRQSSRPAPKAAQIGSLLRYTSLRRPPHSRQKPHYLRLHPAHRRAHSGS